MIKKKFVPLMLSVLMISSVGCQLLGQGPKKKSIGRDAPVSEPNLKFRVAIMDDGFDESLAVFKGKILAKLSITCDEEPDDTSDKETSIEDISYEDLKMAVIQSINTDDSSCKFVEQMEFAKSASFKEISKFREPWNEYFLKKQDLPSFPSSDPIALTSYPTNNTSKSSGLTGSDAKQVYKVLKGEEKFNYHGTHVASLVAYKNDNVDLVLIQKKLKVAGETSEEKINCFSQAELDKIAKIYRDPDVIKANNEAPLRGEEKNKDEVFTKYNIDFLNTSFGKPPTLEIEKIFKESGCPAVKFSEFFASMNEFESKREISIRKRGLIKSKALQINAFGNDSLPLNKPEDGEECSKVFTLNVGASDANGKPASFTNTGDCLDVWAPGVRIIAGAPEDFLLSVNGTSFSSPLFLRYLTQTGKPQESYEDLYTKFKSSKKSIEPVNIANELFYDRSDQLSSFALAEEQKFPKRQPFKKLLPFKIKGIKSTF